MNEDDYDMIYKIVLIGDSGVGKSNLLSRYTKNEFSLQTKTTVGVEFGAKKFEIEDSKVKAQIWDTAGQERYKSITSCYYKGAKGAIIVYDITKNESFINVDKWLSEFKRNADSDACYILIGNKCDLTEERRVTTEEGMSKAELYSKYTILNLKEIPFMETSALEKINIEEAFQTLVAEIHNNFLNLMKDREENLTLEKDNPVDIIPTTKQKKKCCL
jgi:Ras-related protein Rab-11A